MADRSRAEAEHWLDKAKQNSGLVGIRDALIGIGFALLAREEEPPIEVSQPRSLTPEEMERFLRDNGLRGGGV